MVGGNGGGTTNPTEPISSEPSDYPWYVSLTNWVSQSISNALNFFEGGLGDVFVGFGEALENLGAGVANLPSYVWGQFELGFETGQAIMRSILDAIGSIAQPILDKIDDSTGGILTGIGNIGSSIWSFLEIPIEGISWLLNGVYETIIQIPDILHQLTSYLDPFGENFILKIAFVPTQDYSMQYKELISQKFQGFEDITKSFDSLKNFEPDLMKTYPNLK